VDEAFDLADGFLRAVLRVNGVRDLERALSYWVNVSEQSTVGAIGTRGGSPVIEVRLQEDRFVVNRDTKRSAVRAFLAAAARAGDARDLPWHVTYNRDGKIDRISYRADEAPTPGW
jgi:hypothetical protein